MEFAALGDFDGTPEDVPHGIGKFLTRVARICQHVFDIRERGLVQAERLQGSCPVGHIRRGAVNRVWQPLRIHRDMTLEARYQLAAVLTFFFGSISVLHALCLNDDDAGFVVPTMGLSHRANHIFLRLPPSG